MNRIMFSILRILDRKEKSVGSKELARDLRSYGIEISERTVRYYLKILDNMGLSRVDRKKGRMITQEGRRELENAFVPEKINFVINRIDSLSYLMDFSIDTLKGKRILNVSFFPEKRAKDVIKGMMDVFSTPYVISNKIVIAKAGERIGDLSVPDKHIGIGTVCSITLNGIFLKSGIPVCSKYGGVMEVENGVPKRFVALISYEGSSMDPMEIFIKGKMTDVKGIVRKGSGKVLASFREIPIVSMNEAQEICKRLYDKGIKGKIIFGKPNQPLLDIPVGVDKVGIIVPGGLNPVGAVEEAGIESVNIAMSTLYDYSKLLSFNDAVSKFLYG